MSQVEVIPVQAHLDLSPNSPTPSDTFSGRLHSESHPLDIQDTDEEPHIISPDLPPLQYGHPNFHLRNGIMKALSLAADGEPDAERAFFVADLSQVYLQWQRWKRCLPEIEPFFGTSPTPLKSRVLGLFRPTSNKI